jgi:SPP1 gp7 family putative phage head morphogenesis protein
MPDLQKRRLLIKRRRKMMKAAGFKVTKKGKKVPRQIVPVTLERDYFRQIIRAINPAFVLIREELIPRLQEIRDLFLNNTQFDGMRLDSTYSELITKIMKSIKAGSAILITDLVVRDIADKNANAISLFNKYQVSKQMTSVLGVNPIITEPYLEPLVKGFTERNVALIKTIPEQYLNQVETTIRTGVEAGKTTRVLTSEIQERFVVSKNRAKLIARDQVSKFNSSLTKVRQQEVGVSEYIWRTSGDERVRSSHRAKDGKKFKWSKPPSDTGHPGQDYQCRCTAEPVMDDFFEE